MPQKGQKSITISETVYKLAEKMAEKEGKSVAGKVAEIIEKESQGNDPRGEAE